MLRKFIKIFSLLLLLLVLTIGIISIKHPIILKWLSGTARYIGKPIDAKVYTDGQLNTNIKVFHINKYWDKTSADYYIVHFAFTPVKEGISIISIHKKDNYVGVPSGSNKRDYDKIFRRLFQSEVGSKFTSFTNDMKGYNIDPQLSFTNKTIKLRLPPNSKEFKYDSLRIELE